jgi:hypothetical protein
MATSREAIYEALFALLSASPVWQTAGRRLIHWSSIGAQPALFLRPFKEEPLPSGVFGINPRYSFTAEAWIYVANGDPTTASSTNITDLLDLVDNLLRGDNLPQGRVTLGGLVEHVWREGETVIASGEPQTQSVAIVPINILVTDILVPRPKVLSLTCNPSTGTLTTGQGCTLTLGFNVPVEIGPYESSIYPSLTLNTGESAAFVIEAGFQTSLNFTYTVQEADASPALAVTACNLNGATITDAYGKNADLANAVGQPPGTLTIN